MNRAKPVHCNRAGCGTVYDFGGFPRLQKQRQRQILTAAGWRLERDGWKCRLHFPTRMTRRLSTADLEAELYRRGVFK